MNDTTFFRQVAWLDLTLNKGNSGGPIIKMGKSYKDDEVIGIATFILNPSGNAAGELVSYYSEPRPDVQMNGISIDLNEVNHEIAND